VRRWREILKRRIRTKGRSDALLTAILPIGHPEWNTRFASILVSTGGSVKNSVRECPAQISHGGMDDHAAPGSLLCCFEVV
jgi:hypothetical protein